MELCPNCGHMTAEREHYTNTLICYTKDCLYNHPYSGVYKGMPYPGYPKIPCPQCGGSVREPWKRYPACRLCNHIDPNT